MSTEKRVRSFLTDLEVRSAGRTIVGRAAPYNSPTQITEHGRTFTEQFLPGAFGRSIAERGNRVKLLANHDRGSFPVGRAAKLWETPDGLYLEGRVSQTQAGDELLTLVGDGVVSGLSVGFKAVTESEPSYGVRHIHEAALIEISATAFPAYADAQIERGAFPRRPPGRPGRHPSPGPPCGPPRFARAPRARPTGVEK